VGGEKNQRFTVLDLVLPRILSGESIGRKELAAMGHGGLCRNCKVCQYPVCRFGKDKVPKAIFRSPLLIISLFEV